MTSSTTTSIDMKLDDQTTETTTTTSDSSTMNMSQTEPSSSVTMGRQQFRLSRLEEEDYETEMTLQEELNEILEAFYELVSEKDIKTYQHLVEHIQKVKVAEGALKEGSVAPDFCMKDQDGEWFHLQEQLKNGPVVVLFYRGKWCPHCNATIMRMQKTLDAIKAKGATFVAVSPMLPDGTAALATKRLLEFPVLSDIGNELSGKFKITFIVPPEVRPSMADWGEDVSAFNGDETWEIPVPATYIISGKERKIVWSCVDNDPGIRAEPGDIVAAIPSKADRSRSLIDRLRKHALRHNSSGSSSKDTGSSNTLSNNKGVTFNVSTGTKKLFGRKKQRPMDFLAEYHC